MAPESCLVIIYKRECATSKRALRNRTGASVESTCSIFTSRGASFSTHRAASMPIHFYDTFLYYGSRDDVTACHAASRKDEEFTKRFHREMMNYELHQFLIEKRRASRPPVRQYTTMPSDSQDYIEALLGMRVMGHTSDE